MHCSAENAAVLCENRHEGVRQFLTSPSVERRKRKLILVVWQLSGAVLSRPFFERFLD